MIEKLMARFGYVRKSLLDDVFEQGYRRGQRDTTSRAESIVAVERAENEALKREREHIHKVLAEHAAVTYKPPPIIVTPGNKHP